VNRTPIRGAVLACGLCLVAGVASPEIVASERTVLGDGIAHYTFDVDLGPDQFDTIRLHRVVREKRPNKPVATVDGVFLLPGSPNSFEMIFLEPAISAVPAWDQSVAVFLAKNGVDVWGLDYAWVLVPPETSDFAFMQGWGLEREIEYVTKALGTARSIRLSTGQGERRLHLLGFSYGVPLAYAIAGNETLLPPGRRLVKGIIPVDYDMKVNDETQRQAACIAAAEGEAAIESGQYQSDDGIYLRLFASLAKFDPDGASPFFPGLTNRQFLLFVGGVHDPWHFVGAEFDPFPIPTGLRFTDPDLFVDVILAVPPYVPMQASVDLDRTRCDEVDVPFDDHLSDITIPILTIGAAGGAGPDPYTPSLTSSWDVEHFTVQLLSDEEFMFDFGHADLFTAGDAEALVWQPLLEWILAHREGRTYP